MGAVEEVSELSMVARFPDHQRTWAVPFGSGKISFPVRISNSGRQTEHSPDF
jgi:hypothetical protein